MPVVTDIRVGKRKATRRNIFLDGEFWSAMTAECLDDLGWVIGTNLSKEDISKASEHIAQTEAFSYCLRALSMRARTKYQLTVGLKQREFADEVIEETLAHCQDLLLLDDESYAEMLIADKIEGGYGLTRISRALADAGIEQDMAEEMLEALDEEVFAEKAEAVIRRRWRNGIPHSESQKAYALLLRRGYNGSIVSQALENVGRPEEDEETSFTKVKAYDVERLTEQVKRKYPNIRDFKESQKAWGYLSRRHVSSEDIRSILDAIKEG